MFKPSCSFDFMLFTQLLTFFSLGSVSSSARHGYKLGPSYYGKDNPYTNVVTHNRNMG